MSCDNSWNGPVRTMFAYLVTTGCCQLQSTPFVNLYTSRNNVAIAGNIL